MTSIASARAWIGRLLWTLFPPPATEQRLGDVWSGPVGRLQRYAILEGFADTTIYAGPHGDAVRRRRQDGGFGAYRHTRAIASPFATVVDFHGAHLLGPDALDPDAGPGDPVPSCLPIVAGRDADQQQISAAIAALWSASNWAANKELLGWYGAALGDVGLEVIADEGRRKVRLRIVHPGEIADEEHDAYGHTRYVSLERTEIDPADPQQKREAAYRKEVTNDGGIVTVRTYRDDRPYQWPGTPGSEWRLPWGFVPFVAIKHLDRGRAWGVSELSKMLARGVNLDSQESALCDQVLKAVKVPYFLRGAALKPGEKLKLSVAEDSDDVLIVTCTSTDASLTPMVYDVPIGDASAHAQRLESIIARDYPELVVSDTVGAGASGESRREARRRAEAKIKARRAGYDAGQVRAQQMAMTIGGTLGFPGFEPFGPSSFEAGITGHRIGDREVLGTDPAEAREASRARAEDERIRAETAATYLERVGLPLEDALRRVGWTEAQWAAIQERLEARRLEQQQQEDRFRTDVATDF